MGLEYLIVGRMGLSKLIIAMVEAAELVAVVEPCYTSVVKGSCIVARGGSKPLDFKQICCFAIHLRAVH